MTEQEMLERLGYAPGSKGDRWTGVGYKRDYHGGGYMIWRCDDGWHVEGSPTHHLRNGRGAHIIDNPEHVAATFIDALNWIDIEHYGEGGAS